ncbi:putative cyclin-dependent kinase F-2 [Triticum dicoccoides]|uniref:putative cyclin-dependent kinase F-2 n=1 Tax=Triticum dicoccoides TaxID=85692 RepID=UPI00188E5471|nr:putative cyclin-dependent kinase F-2 [Triticum dicoccoides]
MAVKRVFPGDHPDFKVDTNGGAPMLTFCKRVRYWSSTDYQETRVLGEGGYGGVVEAHHLTHGWIVAVKKPLPCAHEAAGIACGCADARTLREAAFLAACHRHRAIVELRALSLDPFAGKLFVVMECVGPSLHHVLHGHRRGQPFPEADVRCIMEQLLGATKHMHGLCIIHCDIKPGNILVGADGISNVKICDLGLAVSVSEPAPYGQHGTRRYMAPEMLLGKTDYNATVDMWSLGCVMAELLSWKPLFDGDDEAQQLLAIFRVLGVPLFTIWPAYESLLLPGKLVTPPHVIVGELFSLNKLRQHFPEDIISKEGFEVLKGLLSCKIDKRLSATTAVRRPWFANAVVDASA